MSEDDLDEVAKAVARQSGVVLPPHRPEVIAGLLAPVGQRFALADLAALAARLRCDDDALQRAVAEALATGASGFFRDPDVFGRLADEVIPHLAAARTDRRRLRIWSAACAAGQEAYSVAVLLAEAGLQDWSVEIVATDFSAAMVARGQAGRYAESELSGLSDARRAAWFERDGEGWCAGAALRAMVTFRCVNLLDPFDGLGPFDLILCRNVLFYFDGTTARSVLARIAAIIVPGGALMLGRGENAPVGRFRPVAPGLYLKE